MKVAMIGLLTFIFFIHPSQGKELLQLDEINPKVEKCLQEILSSELVKDRFPSLLSNQHDQSGYQFLKEVNLYCQCHAKNLSFEDDLKKKDQIAFEFRDRSKGHAVMDQCSLEHFSKYNLGIYFELIVSTRIRYTVENKLQGRMPAGVRHFASQKSLHQRLLCLETKILKKCTKIQSIHATYRCIQSHFSHTENMEAMGKQCPNFNTKGDENFEAMGEMI